MNRILILLAHPSLHRSEINKPLAEASRAQEGVTLIDLYAEYPTFKIDIETEQRRLREHDIIIFMFPLYWYSTPSILKEWQDLVLEYGFAYGSQGKALAGKTFFCALSAGGLEKGYQTDGYSHFTIRELLQPLEQTASITRMKYLPPFTLFGSRKDNEELRIQAHIQQWVALLKDLHHQAIEAEDAAYAKTLNEYLLDHPTSTDAQAAGNTL